LRINDPAPAAVILGCSGPVPTERERRFFEQVNPLGFILFARNIQTPDQVTDLVASLRASVGRADAPVLIDQEGGRVQRLRPPHWRAAPPGSVFAHLDRTDPGRAEELLRLNFRLIGRDLAALGIDVDCAPVLDARVAGADPIIGDRAYGERPERVAALGRAAMDGLLDEGVTPIVKHIPGHGRARVDSHLALPVVETALDDLDTLDFAPFRALADAPWAMTAHVVYAALDDRAPATLSSRVIDGIVRGRIGFDGVLVSDDLSMKALGGAFDERARMALAAGCDVVLHCNGDMAEMEAVAAGCRPLSETALIRLDRAAGLRRKAKEFDVAAALAAIDGLAGAPCSI
jgi:beta-N-acetylhexosaminidase